MGDVLVSLRSAAWIKHRYPELRLNMVTRDAWMPLVRRCAFLSGWCSLEDFMAGNLPWPVSQREHIVLFYSRPAEALQARRTGFKKRTGTAHRWWHWTYSNERVFFSRKRSSFHESQLNLILLRKAYPEVWPCPLDELKTLSLFSYSDNERRQGMPRRIALHPFSNKSAPLWPRHHWEELIRILKTTHGPCELFLTGLAQDRHEADNIIHRAGFPDVGNMCGAFSLEQFTSFLEGLDAIVAPSTGPLHLAAALGLKTIGLYVPRRPMHPGRWAPLGRDVSTLTGTESCTYACRSTDCTCMKRLTPAQAAEALMR